MEKILVLGGAGFIGSNIVSKFVNHGFKVTVIDAFVKGTGASMDNLSSVLKEITYIQENIQKVSNLSEILADHDLIVDCMGWSAHHEGIANPEKDIKLNLLSHLAVIMATKNVSGVKLIYLGSRGQYGNVSKEFIDEQDCMVPEDVQGIDKLSAEHYYRIYSKYLGYSVCSLRLTNCYGTGQMTHGKDIGLVGGFIRDALENREIEVYGNNRYRSVLYADDIAEIVYRLCGKVNIGFSAVNVNGRRIKISELAHIITGISNSGNVVEKELPQSVKNIDVGNAYLSETKLRELIPDLEYSDMKQSLTKTINYFKQSL